MKAEGARRPPARPVLRPAGRSAGDAGTTRNGPTTHAARRGGRGGQGGGMWGAGARPEVPLRVITCDEVRGRAPGAPKGSGLQGTVGGPGAATGSTERPCPAARRLRPPPSRAAWPVLAPLQPGLSILPSQGVPAPCRPPLRRPRSPSRVGSWCCRKPGPSPSPLTPPGPPCCLHQPWAPPAAGAEGHLARGPALRLPQAQLAPQAEHAAGRLGQLLGQCVVGLLHVLELLPQEGVHLGEAGAPGRERPQARGPLRARPRRPLLRCAAPHCPRAALTTCRGPQWLPKPGPVSGRPRPRLLPRDTCSLFPPRLSPPGSAPPTVATPQSRVQR